MLASVHTSHCGARLHEGLRCRLLILGPRDSQGRMTAVGFEVDDSARLQQHFDDLHMTSSS